MKYQSFTHSKPHPLSAISLVPLLLLLGVAAGFAQSGTYFYTGSITTVTLNPGIYNIIAYGAQGGACYQSSGGLGAKMGGEFYFTSMTTLTLLVGDEGAAGSGQYGAGGGGGGGTFVVNATIPLVVAGGGGGGGAGGSAPGNTGTSGGSGNVGIGPGGGGVGGVNGGGGEGSGIAGGGGGFLTDGYDDENHNGRSFLNGGAGADGGGFGGGGGGSTSQVGGGGGGYSGGGGGGEGVYNNFYGFGGGGGGSIIDASALKILSEGSGVPSLDGSANGEIIITQVPEPSSLALAGLGALSFWLFHRRRK